MDTEQSTYPGEEVSSSSPNGYATEDETPGRVWQRFTMLFRSSVFPADALPWPFAHPLAGYLVAFLLQIAAGVAMVLLIGLFPSFHFPALLIILVVLIVALGWGMGPSIAATILGAVLLVFFLLPPAFSPALARREDMIDLWLTILVSLCISLLAGQTRKAHLRTERMARRLFTMMEAMPDPIVLYDQDGTPLLLNRIARARAHPEGRGLSLAQLEQQMEVFTPDGKRFSPADLPLSRALRGEIVEGLELRYQSSSAADDRILAVSAAPLRVGPGNTIEGAITITHDISALYRAEQEAAERAAQLAAVVDAITDPIFIVALGVPVQMNPAARTLLGVSETFQAGQEGAPDPLFELFDIQGNPLPLDQWPQTLILAGQQLHGSTASEILLHTHDGRNVRLRVTGAPVRVDGRIRWAVLVCRDITEQYALEQQLLIAREEAVSRSAQLEGLFEAITDAVLVYDANGHLHQTNAAARALLARYTQKEELDVPLHLRAESHRPHLPDGETMPLEQVPSMRLMRGETLTGANMADVVMHAFDGENLWLNITGTPLRNEQGQIVGAVALARDVTQQRQLVQQVRASQQEALHRASELDAIIEAMADGVFIYDRDHNFVRINPAGRDLLGFQQQPEQMQRVIMERDPAFYLRDVAGHPLPEEQWPLTRVFNGETLQGATAVDVLVTTLDEREIIISYSGAPILDDQGQVVGAVVICRDVTERYLLQQRTRSVLEALLRMAQIVVQGSEELAGQDLDLVQATERSRQVMQRMAELTRDVLACSRVGFIRVEPGTERLRPLAVVGLSPEQEQQWWQEQEAQEVSLGEGSDPALVERLRANEIFVLDLTRPPYQVEHNPYGVRQMLVAPLILGTAILGVLTLDYGGLEHQYTNEEFELARAVTRLAVLVMERDRLLVETAQARVNELAALEASRLKDEFLGIASHELRTPMTTMKANIQLARRHIRRQLKENGDPARSVLGQLPQFLERAEQQMVRQERLVRDLLDASRIETGQLEIRPEPCDLVTIVHEAVEDQQQMTPNRQIVLAAPEIPIQVLADRDRIRQVISNYLSNALKYSDADQPVHVEVEMQGNEVCMSVHDRGTGLTTEQQAHIWDRFYRVPSIEVRSGSGVGLGLGLYISRMLIERQDGRVGVRSEPGKGSTFWFSLPVMERT